MTQRIRATETPIPGFLSQPAHLPFSAPVRYGFSLARKSTHCWTSACFGPLAFAYSAA